VKLATKIAAIVFAILTVFFYIYARLNYTAMRDYHQAAIRNEIDVAIGNIVERMNMSEELEAYVMGKMDEKNLALSRTLAEIIKNTPEMLEPAQMERLVIVLGVDEVHVTDDKGVLLWGNIKDFYGFDFATADQTKPFLKILTDKSFELAQAPEPRGTTGDMFQYTGVTRTDGTGIVQIGLNANIVSEMHELLGVQHSIANMKIGDTGFAFIIRDGKYMAHQREQNIGADISGQSWYNEINAQAEGYAWLDIEGTSYYLGYKNMNGTVVAACLPEAEYYGYINGFRLKNILMAFFIGLAAVIVIWVMVNRLVIKPVTRLSKDISQLAKGDLSINGEGATATGHKNAARDRVDEIGVLQKSFGELVHANRQQAELIRSIAEGDLTGSYTPRSDDDVVGQSLVEMLEHNNTALTQVMAASNQLTGASREISHGSQTLAQGASEQAAAIEELSATVNEITDMIHSGSEMIDKAANLSVAIKSGAEKGNRQMDQMVEAIKDIRSASVDISKIIKVIDDIAFQTNILALNAAVEAARAGQHGKGFAVVADEVRNLASKSAAAAKDTGTLITDTMEKSELGVRITNETAASLAEIVRGIGENSSIISDIAAAHKRQETAITQINTSIGQVAQVVHQNSATAEESAASSAEMAEQTDMLNQSVSAFRLKNMETVEIRAAHHHTARTQSAAGGFALSDGKY